MKPTGWYRSAKGPLFRSVANYGLTAEQLRAMKDIQIVAGRGSVAGRVILEGRAVHVPDVLADPEFTWRSGNHWQYKHHTWRATAA